MAKDQASNRKAFIEKYRDYTIENACEVSRKRSRSILAQAEHKGTRLQELRDSAAVLE